MTFIPYEFVPVPTCGSVFVMMPVYHANTPSVVIEAHPLER